LRDTFRAFIAVEIGESVKDLLAGWVRQEAPKFPGVRFVPPENLHITLQFLGDVERSHAAALTEALRSSVAGIPEFRLALGEAGSFPERGSPRVLHVTIGQGKDELLGLADKVRATLESHGFHPDHPFVAHITIGRAKDTGGRTSAGRPTAQDWRRSFRSYLSSHGDVPATWRISRVLLMESILGRGGPTYIARGAADLAPPAG